MVHNDLFNKSGENILVIAVGAGADGFEIASLFAQSSGSLGQGGGDDCLPDTCALSSRA